MDILIYNLSTIGSKDPNVCFKLVDSMIVRGPGSDITYGGRAVIWGVTLQQEIETVHHYFCKMPKWYDEREMSKKQDELYI